jgi:hypothetical protein
MQKVVGSSPIIRSEKAPLDGAFCCLRSNRQRLVCGDCAHSCPFKRPVVRAAVRPGEPFAPLRRLRVTFNVKRGSSCPSWLEQMRSGEIHESWVESPAQAA